MFLHDENKGVLRAVAFDIGRTANASNSLYESQTQSIFTIFQVAFRAMRFALWVLGRTCQRGRPRSGDILLAAQWRQHNASAFQPRSDDVKPRTYRPHSGDIKPRTYQPHSGDT